MTFLGQDWLFFVKTMTILSQDWVCRDWIKYSDGRQSAYSHWSMTFLGQDWVCRVRRIPFFRQDWLFFVRTINFLGQDWVCHDWINYSDGRQSARSSWSITILGQVWPTECPLQLEHNHSWPSLVILRSHYDHSWPRLVILQKALVSSQKKLKKMVIGQVIIWQKCVKIKNINIFLLIIFGN